LFRFRIKAASRNFYSGVCGKNAALPQTPERFVFRCGTLSRRSVSGGKTGKFAVGTAIGRKAAGALAGKALLRKVWP
jgi:hypothetical protein